MGLILFGEVRQPLASFGPAIFFADNVNHAVREDIAEFIQGHHLAAALEAGVDGQHSLAPRRLLEEQFAEIADEDLDGVFLRLFGLFAAGFALQAGNEQTGQGVSHALTQKLRMRMPFGNQQLLGFPQHCFGIRLDLHTNGPGSLAAIDGQHPMRRHFVQRFLEVVIILERVLADNLFLFLLLGLLQSLLHVGRFGPFGRLFKEAAGGDGFGVRGWSFWTGRRVCGLGRISRISRDGFLGHDCNHDYFFRSLRLRRLDGKQSDLRNGRIDRWN